MIKAVAHSPQKHASNYLYLQGHYEYHFVKDALKTEPNQAIPSLRLYYFLASWFPFDTLADTANGVRRLEIPVGRGNCGDSGRAGKRE